MTEWGQTEAPAAAAGGQERQAEQRAVRASRHHEAGRRLPGGTFWMKRRNATRGAGGRGLMRG